MKKVSIGGDRLGAGKQMQVEIQNFERSTHNLGAIIRTTQSPGTILPVLNLVGLPGDTWTIRMDARAKTLPTIGPLFGSAKLQLDASVAPVRLYNGLMHNNTLGIGRKISNVKLPQMRFYAQQNLDPDTPITDMDNCQVNPSCILAYLGIRGIGSWDGVGDIPTREYNITALLAYWDFYKNYYANKQEEIGAVIHSPQSALVETIDDIQIAGNSIVQAPAEGGASAIPGYQIQIFFTAIDPEPKPEQVIINISLGGGARTDMNLTEIAGPFTLTAPGTLTGTYFRVPATIYNWRYINPQDLRTGKPKVQTFALSKLDDMRTAILTNTGTAPFVVNDDANFEPYSYLYVISNDVPSILSSQEGLALKTFQNDLFNNWINAEWIDGVDGVTALTAIDTSGGSFTMDQLNISSKVYNLMNKIAMSDGTLDTWQEVVYGHAISGKPEIPMYMGGLSKEIVFDEVISNSESDDQPLGTLAGRGTFSNKHKGGYVEIKINEISYIQIFASITPRIDYSQGNVWDVNLKTLDDFHKPDLDEIGFQDSINEYRAWWTTKWDGTKWVQTSAGKVPAWMDYMTNVNRTYGNFAVPNSQMFMTYNRRYVPDTDNDIADLTTYIDPSKFNFIFAQTELDAQNFWMQYGFDITVRRKMSGKIMPAL